MITIPVPISVARKIVDAQVAILVKKDVITTNFREARYERKIRKSQKKIGTYVATPKCKTIYA